jgi:4-hydroxy-3-polyprenylbenzoate decarboxylase
MRMLDGNYCWAVNTMAMDNLVNGRTRQRIVVGISGATGIIYGVRALQMLRELGIETHLVVSRAGEMTREYETALSRSDLHALADVVHPIADVGASIASGSYRTLGMLIAPCSVRTLAEIASGVTTTLLTRAADVALKERRRVVLMVREAPLHAGHIRNMLAVTESGGIIHPPVPAFYTKPTTIEHIVDHSVARALDCFGLAVPSLPRWGENPSPSAGNDEAERAQASVPVGSAPLRYARLCGRRRLAVRTRDGETCA